MSMCLELFHEVGIRMSCGLCGAKGQDQDFTQLYTVPHTCTTLKRSKLRTSLSYDRGCCSSFCFRRKKYFRQIPHKPVRARPHRIQEIHVTVTCVTNHYLSASRRSGNRHHTVWSFIQYCVRTVVSVYSTTKLGRGTWDRGGGESD